MTFVDKAVEASPLANAMKTVYLSVINASIAHVMISTIPIDIHLPLNHPLLNKHHITTGVPCEDADDDNDPLEGDENDRASYGGRWGVDEWEENEANMWDEEMRYAFKMQPLKPWKTILLMENELELAAVAAAAGVGGEAEGEAGLEEFMGVPTAAARKEGEKIHPLRKFLAFLSENVTLSYVVAFFLLLCKGMLISG